MKALKKIKAVIDKHFEKYPIVGHVIYGICMGFVGSVCLILLLLGFSVLFGIYSRLDIDYKTWRIFIAAAVIIAVLDFIFGAYIYFPYRRRGKNLFKKAYTKGTSYRALHHLLAKNDEKKE